MSDEERSDIITRLSRDVFYGDARLAKMANHNPLHLDAVNEIQRLRADKDEAYLERNQVVAALATIFPAGIARTAIPGWDPEWHGCVYIDLPTGQASWHYHDGHAHLFAHLPPYTKPWDGHTTKQKYQRLAMLTVEAAMAGDTEEQVRSEASHPTPTDGVAARTEGMEEIIGAFIEAFTVPVSCTDDEWTAYVDGLVTKARAALNPESK